MHDWQQIGPDEPIGLILDHNTFRVKVKCSVCGLIKFKYQSDKDFDDCETIVCQTVMEPDDNIEFKEEIGICVINPRGIKKLIL